MAIRKISHIGIAVRDLDQQKQFYQQTLGLELLAEEEVPDQKVKIAMFAVGDARIELLEPTGADSPVERFLQKRGEGIHHIAYAVTDLRSMLARLSAQGVGLIDEQPRSGAEGHQIAFIHPKSAFGVLTELCESPR